MNRVNSYLDQVQAGVDYIESHLGQDFDADDVANAAGLSRWYFQRIFKALTDETLKTYIRSRRMAGALEQLVVSDDRILDIALEAGYDTQESFTRAFNCTFGLTPNAYRKIGSVGMFHRKVQVSGRYMEQIKMNKDIAPEIYRQEPMQLVGLYTQFYGIDSDNHNAEEVLPMLWEQFESRFGEIQLRDDAVCYGVTRCTEGPGDELDYFAAARKVDCGFIPADMASIDVPESTYARFIHRGSDTDIQHTVSYIYGNWLMQSGRQHSNGLDLEIFGPDYDPKSANAEMYYAIPVFDD